MSSRSTIRILGAGPAGATAAIAAALEGADVEIADKSVFPRHKACGEFFSPGALPVLDSLGVRFLEAGAVPVRRMSLHFGSRRAKSAKLPETAWGLSRRTFDALLHSRLAELGIAVKRGSLDEPTVLAIGRNAPDISNVASERFADRGQRKRGRLFGFKAHFRGPANDAVELYFFDGCYVGVSQIESGLTNVCGLGPESALKRFAFDFDEVIRQSAPLEERLEGMHREIEWLATGPLVFGNRFRAPTTDGVYATGDALSFVDPFTGSGLLAAVTTGALAGEFAARHRPVSEYLVECGKAFAKPFEVASVFRKMVSLEWAAYLAPLVPGRLLFRWTRP